MKLTKMMLPLALALGTLGLVVVTQLASATHPRPVGATPVRVSLAIAYKPCTSPNRSHGAPLAAPSCNPPVQASNFLTVGSRDANGAGANSVGFVQFRVAPTPPHEVLISANISDVRCKPATDAAVCSSANAVGGPDYSGELGINAIARITDHYNGPGLNEAGTVEDVQVGPILAVCAKTADTSTGGLCRYPVVECLGCPPTDGRRAIGEIQRIEVSDGGADGQLGTQDNTLFMHQGIFVP